MAPKAKVNLMESSKHQMLMQVTFLKTHFSKAHFVTSEDVQISIACNIKGSQVFLFIDRYSDDQYRYGFSYRNQAWEWQDIVNDVQIDLYLVNDDAIVHEADMEVQAWRYGQKIPVQIREVRGGGGSLTIIAILTSKEWLRMNNTSNREQVEHYLDKSKRKEHVVYDRQLLTQQSENAQQQVITQLREEICALRDDNSRLQLRLQERSSVQVEQSTAEVGVQTGQYIVYIFVGEQFVEIDKELLLQKAPQLAALITSNRQIELFEEKYVDPRIYEQSWDMDDVIILNNVKLNVVQSVVSGLQSGNYQFDNELMAFEVRTFARTYDIQEAIRASSDYIVAAVQVQQ